MSGEAKLKRKRCRGILHQESNHNTIISSTTTEVEVITSNSPSSDTRKLKPLRRGRLRDHRTPEIPSSEDTTKTIPLPINDEIDVARASPSMDSVVKVFCVHTEPDFSLPWQRKRQFSSSSSGFVISGRRVLTKRRRFERE